MIAYICLILYITIIAIIIFLKKPYTREKNRRFIIFAFASVFFLSAMRGENVGWDTSEYINIYNLTANGIILSRIEPLYILLMKLCLKLSSNSQVLFAISSAIVYTGIGFFILNNTPDGESTFWPVFLFIVLGEYFTTMNLLRQSIAMSVGCNVYTILEKEKNWKSILLSILLAFISFSFHTTGALCVLLFLPFMLFVSKKKVVIAYIVGVSIFSLYPVLLSIILRLFPNYGWYLNSSFNYSVSSGYYLGLAVVEVVATIMILCYIDPQSLHGQDIYRILIVISFSFTFILLQYRISLAMRAGYLFELFLILLIPLFIQHWGDIRIKLPAKIMLYLLGWAYYFYSMLGTNSRGCVPYTFFWQ